MNRAIRRSLALVTVSLTPLALVACGSSGDDSATPAVDSTPTTVDTGDFAIDQSIDTGAAEAALLAMDDQALTLPDDAQSSYDRLKTDLESAKNATGNDAETAWSKVGDDVKDVDTKIDAAGDRVDNATKDAWSHVKDEFDKITSHT